MLRKEKKKVVDEVWTDERIRRFLHLLPPEGVDCDFHRLRRAYQAMRPEDFEDFIALFVAEGGRLDARGPEGQTLLDELARHRHGEPFAAILRQASHP
ncbi:MAG: PA4642 family protein [Pseudomonadales bacterium]|nr:PA4642 family protein [Pseudomonadales bacterium]MCP5336400.1 PA4642 family protein [Pseudomonadales bacterium]